MNYTQPETKYTHNLFQADTPRIPPPTTISHTSRLRLPHKPLLLPRLPHAPRPRDGQAPLHQLVLNHLPPPDPHLLVDGRHAPPVDLYVGQVEQVGAAAARGADLLEDLEGLGRAGEDGDEVLRRAQGGELGVREAVARELVDALVDLCAGC